MRISDWSSDVCSSDLSLSARVTVSLPDWRRLSAPRFAFGSGRLGSGRFGASTGVKRRGAGAALVVAGRDAGAASPCRSAAASGHIGDEKGVCLRLELGGRRHIIKNKNQVKQSVA